MTSNTPSDKAREAKGSDVLSAASDREIEIILDKAAALGIAAPIVKKWTVDSVTSDDSEWVRVMRLEDVAKLVRVIHMENEDDTVPRAMYEQQNARFHNALDLAEQIRQLAARVENL